MTSRTDESTALAQAALVQTGLEYYQLFVNALSFTLAVTSVDKYFTNDSGELIVLVITLAVIAVFLTVLDSEIMSRFHNTSDERTAQLLAGPVGLISYLLQTGTRVLVHFLSTSVGRWVMTLTPNDLGFWDTMTAVLIAVSMIWFVGISVSLLQIPVQHKRHQD